MSKRLALSVSLAAFVLCIGFSGCRARQQAYGPGGVPQQGYGQIFPQGNQLGQRVGNIAINRGINAAITGIINGL